MSLHWSEDNVYWLPASYSGKFPTQVLDDPRGNSLEVPDILVTQPCFKCGTTTVREKELGRRLRHCIVPHMRRDLIRARSKYTVGRGPCLCKQCGEKIRGEE